MVGNKELDTLLKNEKLYEKDCVRHKSNVWKSFSLLYYKDSNRYAEYVRCKICSSYLKHHKANSGTSHLRMHLKACENPSSSKSSDTANSKQASITEFVKHKADPPKQAVKQMQNAAVNFVSWDIRPLASVEGKGMVELVQTAIAIGAKYGNMSAEKLLPSRNTVKRKLDQNAALLKTSIVGDVLTAIQQNGFVAITTDLWSDLKMRNFISLTVHFVKNQKLEKFVLAVYQFEEDQKTAYNLKQSIVSTLTDLGISSDVIQKNLYFVTDQGSNIKAALSNYHREPCACHMIATVLRHTLQLDQLSSQILPMQNDDDLMEHLKVLKKNVVAAKSLATYFKKSGLNNKLSSSLKQSNDTRWNSVLTLVQSILKTYDEIEKILSDIGQERRLADIDITLLGNLEQFLQPFFDATKALEGDNFPTIHHVYQWYIKLERFTTVRYTDSCFVKFLKKRASCALNEKFQITPTHKLALFVNPKFKSMRALKEDEKNEILCIAKQYLVELFPTCATASEQGAVDSSPPSENLLLDHAYGMPAGQKKRKTSNIDDEFLDWQDSYCDTANCKVDEITEYVEAVFDDELTSRFCASDGKFNILEFWSSSTIKAKFPSLSKLALGILSIPASSASSERVFSVCGTTISKRRSQLSASTVDALMVVNSCHE